MRKVWKQISFYALSFLLIISDLKFAFILVSDRSLETLSLQSFQCGIKYDHNVTKKIIHCHLNLSNMLLVDLQLTNVGAK